MINLFFFQTVGDIDGLKQLITSLKEKQASIDIEVYDAYLMLLSSLGKSKEMLGVLDEMETHGYKIRTHNNMQLITSYLVKGDWEYVVNTLFPRMREEGIHPTTTAWNRVFTTVEMLEGKEKAAEMIKMVVFYLFYTFELDFF